MDIVVEKRLKILEREMRITGLGVRRKILSLKKSNSLHSILRSYVAKWWRSCRMTLLSVKVAPC